MDSDILKIRFTNSYTVRDKKPYTVYEIEMRSSSSIQWMMYKRYSAFFQLHQQLQNELGNDPKVKLPPLPPKRLTGSLVAEFVDKRRQDLEDYLRALLTIPRVLQSATLLQFLEVPDSILPMLNRAKPNVEGEGGDGRRERGNLAIGLGAGLGGYGGGDGFGDGRGGQGMGALGVGAGGAAGGSSASGGAAVGMQKSPEEQQVLDLAHRLRSQPNKVAALRAFEDYYFENRPKLRPELIRFLFEGKGGGDNDPGLVQLCGDRSSRVASRAALFFICRLLNPERNREAPAFVSEFLSLHRAVLQKLRLHDHINWERGARPEAFNLAALILQLRGAQSDATARILASALNSGQMASFSSRWAGSGSHGDIVLEDIIQDAWARHEFIAWVARRVPLNGVSSQAVGFAEARPTEVGSRAQNIPLVLRADEQHRSLVYQAYVYVLEASKVETDWVQAVPAPPGSGADAVLLSTLGLATVSPAAAGGDSAGQIPNIGGGFNRASSGSAPNINLGIMGLGMDMGFTAGIGALTRQNLQRKQALQANVQARLRASLSNGVNMSYIASPYAINSMLKSGSSTTSPSNANSGGQLASPLGGGKTVVDQNSVSTDYAYGYDFGLGDFSGQLLPGGAAGAAAAATTAAAAAAASAAAAALNSTEAAAAQLQIIGGNVSSLSQLRASGLSAGSISSTTASRGALGGGLLFGGVPLAYAQAQAQAQAKAYAQAQVHGFGADPYGLDAAYGQTLSQQGTSEVENAPIGSSGTGDAADPLRVAASDADLSAWLLGEPFATLRRTLAATGGLTGLDRAALLGRDQISISYRREPGKDAYIVRVSAILPFSVDEVSDILMDPTRMSEWDLTVRSARLVSSLDDSTDIVHIAYRSFSSPFLYRDACVMRALLEMDYDSRRLLVYRSVQHPNCPELRDSRRATVMPSGCILTPLLLKSSALKGDTTTLSPDDVIVGLTKKAARKAARKANRDSANGNNEGTGKETGGIASTADDGYGSDETESYDEDDDYLDDFVDDDPTLAQHQDCCLVTWIHQFDREGILVVTPDLLGEVDILSQSIQNLKVLLAQDRYAKCLEAMYAEEAAIDDEEELIHQKKQHMQQQQQLNQQQAENIAGDSGNDSDDISSSHQDAFNKAANTNTYANFANTLPSGHQIAGNVRSVENSDDEHDDQPPLALGRGDQMLTNSYVNNAPGVLYENQLASAVQTKNNNGLYSEFESNRKIANPELNPTLALNRPSVEREQYVSERQGVVSESQIREAPFINSNEGQKEIATEENKSGQVIQEEDSFLPPLQQQQQQLPQLNPESVSENGRQVETPEGEVAVIPLLPFP